MQDAITADLADLFEGQTLQSSAGDKRPIRVYSQDLPIIEGMDETEDRTEEIPEPYIIVRTNEGNIPDANSAQEIDLILVVCVYDNDPNRTHLTLIPKVQYSCGFSGFPLSVNP